MNEQHHEIEIIINPDGTITAEVFGIHGQACTAISAFLDTLGVVLEDRHTDDYFKKPKQGLAKTQTTAR